MHSNRSFLRSPLFYNQTTCSRIPLMFIIFTTLLACRLRFRAAIFKKKSRWPSRGGPLFTKYPYLDIQTAELFCYNDILLFFSVVTETQSCQHSEVKRSHQRERQPLLCVRIYEGELVPNDEGQVSVTLIVLLNIVLTYTCIGDSATSHITAWIGN